jgi:hypothetical protein
METPEGIFHAPPDGARGLELPEAPIYQVSFTPMPNWLLWKLVELPKPEISVVIVLFLQKYETIPWGGALPAAEIARRAGITERAALRALMRRQRAGWVHQPVPGRYSIGPEGS